MEITKPKPYHILDKISVTQEIKFDKLNFITEFSLFLCSLGGIFGWFHVYLSGSFTHWSVFGLIIVCAVETLVLGEKIVRIIRTHINKQKK